MITPKIHKGVSLTIGCKLGYPPDDNREPSFSLVFLPKSVCACWPCVPFETRSVCDVSLGCAAVAGSALPDELCGFPSMRSECVEV